jgi:hypothetical protein
MIVSSESNTKALIISPCVITNMNRTNFFRIPSLLLLFAAIGFAANFKPLQAQLFHKGVAIPSICPCDPCEPPCGTVFQVSNLQVRVTGKDFNQIEVYFTASEAEQNVKTDTFPNTRDLQFDDKIRLAPAGPAGTFAVRYGPHLDTFKVYSWQMQANDLNAFGPITPEPGHPVCLTFVTPRLLKVTFGPDHSKTKLYRCISNSNAWEDVTGTTAITPKPLPK